MLPGIRITVHWGLSRSTFPQWSRTLYECLHTAQHWTHALYVHLTLEAWGNFVTALTKGTWNSKLVAIYSSSMVSLFAAGLPSLVVAEKQVVDGWRWSVSYFYRAFSCFLVSSNTLVCEGSVAQYGFPLTFMKRRDAEFMACVCTRRIKCVCTWLVHECGKCLNSFSAQGTHWECNGGPLRSGGLPIVVLPSGRTLLLTVCTDFLQHTGSIWSSPATVNLPDTTICDKYLFNKYNSNRL